MKTTILYQSTCSSFCVCVSLLFFVIGCQVLCVSSSSQVHHQQQEQHVDQILWPKAVDDFDQHLINLVRRRRDVEDREDREDDEEVSSSTTPSPKAGNATAKNFTIDWNEVDKAWKKTLPEEEVAKKFADMEKGLKNGVRSLLRTIFPQVVSMSSDAKVSGNCSAGILKWIISLRHLKGWAVKSK